jgi:phosphonate transport system substrate-binding protein
MYFMPSMETGKVISHARKIADYLRTETDYYYRVEVPKNYTEVIEALGNGKADVAWLGTFAYVVANEKYGAMVGLTAERRGSKRYRGQFVALAESDIETLEDVEGRKIAYTDSVSTSGYIYPSALLAQNGIQPEEVYFAGGHPQAMLAVYKGDADVGCAYWAADNYDGPQDARVQIANLYPDVFDKTRVIGYTEWIPNDTVTFRAEFPQEIRTKIEEALMNFVSTQEGKNVLVNMYGIDGFVQAFDTDYDVVRTSLKSLGVNASEYIQ